VGKSDRQGEGGQTDPFRSLESLPIMSLYRTTKVITNPQSGGFLSSGRVKSSGKKLNQDVG